MAFSSFSEFLFMASIDSWRVSRSGYLSFGNRKKAQGAKSVEYGGWAMTFVSCLAKNLVTIRLECDARFLRPHDPQLMLYATQIDLDRANSPKHFCNIFNDSVTVIPLETQNFKQTRCSIFFSIIKNASNKWNFFLASRLESRAC